MGNMYSIFCCTTNEIDETCYEENYVEKYENKYMDKFDILSDERSDSLFQNNYILELTPNGNVIMSYDTENNTFEYYCDRQIPNSFLETVSRKFVIQYTCKYIYHLKSDSKKDESDEKSEDPPQPREISDVYGKFKLKHKSAMKPAIESNINKYKYLGRLCDFNIIKKENKTVSKKEISYKDFNKLN